MCGTEANNWFGGKKDYPYLEHRVQLEYAQEKIYTETKQMSERYPRLDLYVHMNICCLKSSILKYITAFKTTPIN